MNKRGTNGGGSSEVDGVSDMAEICLKKREKWGRRWSQDFFSEGVAKIGCAAGKEREILIILIVRWGRPIRNLVLDGLRVR